MRTATLNDPVLGDLGATADPSRVLDLIRTAIGPGVALAGVTIDDVVYTPTRKCTIVATVSMDGDEPGTSRTVLLTMAKDHRLRPAVPVGRARGQLGYVESERCLVEVFPVDRELPSLPDVMSIEALTPLLRTVRPGVRGWGTPRVLHYRPHRRCVLGIEALGDHLAADVVVKVYSEPGPAHDASARMAALRRSIDGGGLTIPDVLAVSDDLAALVMERAPGCSMKQAIQAADAERVSQLAELVAEALLVLHRQPAVRDVAPRTLQSELAKMRHRAARLEAVVPDLCDDLDRVFDRVEAIAAQLAPSVVEVSHGDFTSSQLLVDGDDVSMVDFDRATPGDPALDLGNFVSRARRDEATFGDGRHRAAERAFLGRYRTDVTDPGLERRTELAAALALARGAIKAFRHAPLRYISDPAASASARGISAASATLERV